ncbi:Vta1 like-domain-containing protein [Phlyctochytrium arcticum]|nr:Vta1 like-domain-containing protein [Phlyctochytrium arcticum]
MPGPPPEELKYINAYLQRAQELSSKEPIVAYYCKYYAAKLAIEKGNKSKEAQIFLLTLMDELEQDRKHLQGNEAITNDVVGYAHVENFALKIFINADNEDRQGQISRKTAKTFLASSIFLELLKVFGELDSDIHDKIRYAKYKAADIIKALREGRTPAPGMPGEDQPNPSQQQDDGFPGPPPAPFDHNPSSSSLTVPTQQPPPGQHPDFGSPYDPSYNPNAYAGAGHGTNMAQPGQGYPTDPYGTSSIASPPTPQFPSNPVTSSPHIPTIPNPQTSHPPAHQSTTAAWAADKTRKEVEVDFKQVQNAQKFSRFAISALQYDDIPSAIENLEKALELLKGIKH